MLVSAYITPRNFEVNEVEVVIPDLPAAFDGYRIAQISDIHLGVGVLNTVNSKHL